MKKRAKFASTWFILSYTVTFHMRELARAPILLFYFFQKKTVEIPRFLRLSGLKRTVSRDFWQFFCYKDSTWAPYEHTKSFLQTFFVFAKIFAINRLKNVSPHSRSRWHGVGVVNNWLLGHRQDFADTFGTFWRLLTDLKGTIRQKKFLGCIYTPNRQ